MENRGHRRPSSRAGAGDVAAATRLKVPPPITAPHAGQLSSPAGLPGRLSCALRDIVCLCARTQTFCSPANLRLSPPVNISRGCQQATDDEEALPHIIISSIIIGGTLGCSYISTSPSLWRGADHVAITSKLLRHLFQLSVRGRSGPQQPWHGTYGCRTVLSQRQLYYLSMLVLDGSLAAVTTRDPICLYGTICVSKTVFKASRSLLMSANNE